MTRVLVIGGGQAGLASAAALRGHGFRPVILEAGDEPGGSWPHYYDSLVLFTPAWLNALPGRALPGPQERFTTRDEMAEYLREYARRLPCEIHTGQRVASVVRGGDGYLATTERGAEFTAPVMVAATGYFDHPHVPDLPGLAEYTGTVLHSGEYRSPKPFAGQRVVVVGGGNSAVQIAVEMAEHADVSLVSRRNLRYVTPRPLGPRSRFWRLLAVLGRIPFAPLLSTGGVPIFDTGGYHEALRRGEPARQEMFTGAEGSRLRWADGSSEHVDTVLLATGYRDRMDYLAPLGAVDGDGRPKQRFGVSTTHTGLGYVGLVNQRTILSGSLYGVGRDAHRVANRLRRQRET